MRPSMPPARARTALPLARREPVEADPRVSCAIQGRSASGFAERAEPVVDPQEDVLEGVLGVGALEPVALRADRVHVARVAQDELVPGVLVAGQAPPDEFRVLGHRRIKHESGAGVERPGGRVARVVGGPERVQQTRSSSGAPSGSRERGGRRRPRPRPRERRRRRRRRGGGRRSARRRARATSATSAAASRDLERHAAARCMSWLELGLRRRQGVERRGEHIRVVLGETSSRSASAFAWATTPRRVGPDSRDARRDVRDQARGGCQRCGRRRNRLREWESGG